MPAINQQNRRRYLVHGMRVAIFAAILLCIYALQDKPGIRVLDKKEVDIEFTNVQDLFPEGKTLAEFTTLSGMRQVFDATDKPIGYVVQTSPYSDHILGFSGPTNVLIAFDEQDTIVGMRIVASGDTRDHVEQVKQDPRFLRSLNGKTWNEIDEAKIDAVSGATLTSFAIAESVIHRLGGQKPSLRFPDSIRVRDIEALFGQVDGMRGQSKNAAMWIVYAQGEQIGTVLTTSPAADQEIGYQGPTLTSIGIGNDQKILGLAIGKSYDNEPYVSYVRQDDYFLHLFNGLSIEQLADLDLQEHGVEGVSGATMTSVGVARSIKIAARQQQQLQQQRTLTPVPRGRTLQLTWQDVATTAIVLFSVVFGFSSLRGNRKMRIVFQLVVIVYLGLIHGAIISQVMLVGWAQNGIPFRSAFGLVALTFAAFVVPITTKHNIYCHHLCPHGTLQQLLRNRVRYRLHLSRTASRLLSLIPAGLLIWVVIVAMSHLPFNLVDIEPFDAWSFRVAGGAAIAIAVVGLVASLFLPMAYCRFGCPTGAMLGYLRLHARSDQFGPRDWLALFLLLTAITLLIRA